MRRRRPWIAQQAVELNVIPLIDVVFFLLVFYVISTSFVPESAVPIDRPRSGRATASQVPSVQVAVTAAGEVVVGGRAVIGDAVGSSVGAELRRLGTTRVVLVADRQVQTGTLLAVMDGCTAGGATSVDVAAIPGASR